MRSPTPTRFRGLFILGTWPVVVLVLMALLIEAPAARSSDRGKSGTTKAPAFAGYKVDNVAFVAFDCETTGLNPKKDRIVELAAVKYKGGKIIDAKAWLLNPNRSIPHWSTKVHGITNDMVKDKPTFKEIYEEFVAFIDGTVLIAHNAPFDISFMNSEVKRYKLKAPTNPIIDSLGLFQSWFPDLDSYRLKTVAEHAKIEAGGFHRALADSMYVALIFEKGARKLDESDRLKKVYLDAGGSLEF